MLSCTTFQSCSTLIAAIHRPSQMLVLFIFPTLLFQVCMQFSYQTSPRKYEAWRGKILTSPLIPCCDYVAPRSDCNLLSGGAVGNVLQKEWKKCWCVTILGIGQLWNNFTVIMQWKIVLGPFPLTEQEMDVMDVLTLATAPPFAVLNSSHDQSLAFGWRSLINLFKIMSDVFFLTIIIIIVML